MDQMLSVLYPTNSVKALNELQDTVIRIDRNQEKLSLAHPFFTLHWRLVLTFKGSYYLYEGCSTPVFFNVCSQHTSTELDLSVNSRIKIRVFRTDLAATVQVFAAADQVHSSLKSSFSANPSYRSLPFFLPG